MNRLSRHPWTLVIVLICACTTEDPPVARPEDPQIVARYGQQGDRYVRFLDLDAALLALPPESRPSPEAMTAEWYAELTREYVAEQLLLERARDLGLESDPELRNAIEEARREIAWGAFRRDNPAPSVDPTEAEIRSAFQARSRGDESSERRELFHIFLRRSTERDAATLRAQLEELRQRVLAGESFAQLATQVSESETRHRRGKIGAVGPEDLSPELSALVFALEEQVPSEPTLTPEGGHIFWVSLAVSAIEHDFAEVHDQLEENLRREKTATLFQETIETLPDPPVPFFVASQQELTALLNSGDPNSIVLRAGAYVVPIGRLANQVAQMEGSGTAPAGAAWALLRRLAGRERIYWQASEIGLFDRLNVIETLEQIEQRETVRLLRQRELLQAISPEEIESFYREQANRFSTPLRVRLRRLAVTIPLNEGPQLMRRLESAGARLESGDLSLDTLAIEVGGEIEDLGWTNLSDLRATRPTAAALVALLQSPGYTPPYSHENALELLHLTERRDPKPRPLSAIFEEVRDHYAEIHARRLEREWIVSTTRAAELQIWQDRLETLLDAEQATDSSLGKGKI